MLDTSEYRKLIRPAVADTVYSPSLTHNLWSRKSRRLKLLSSFSRSKLYSMQD